MGFVLKPGQDITVRARQSSGNLEEFEITQVEEPTFFTDNINGKETTRIVLHAERRL